MNRTLNESQERAVREIQRHKQKNPDKRKEHLLYGDVGSGKTRVAMVLARHAIRSLRRNVILLCPTITLATQHLTTAKLHFPEDQNQIVYMDNKTRTKHQEKSTKGAVLIITTHALAYRDVPNQRKTYAIFVDEQQRFGSGIVDRIYEKCKGNPIIVYMSATPIPRTLTLSAMERIPTSTLHNRQEAKKTTTTTQIKGSWSDEATRRRLLAKIESHTKNNGLAIIVCPSIIKPKKGEDMTDCQGVMETILTEWTGDTDLIGALHGAMKKPRIQEETNRLFNGTTKILVATSIVEVGVHVPTASLMIILDADRFGASQLHQMRGRVGRDKNSRDNNARAECILVTKKGSENIEKIRDQRKGKTKAGIDIAVMDACQRGPGDLFQTGGRQQHGYETTKNVIAKLLDHHIN